MNTYFFKYKRESISEKDLIKGGGGYFKGGKSVMNEN